MPIAEYKAIEETLNKSDLLFKDFFNNAPIGFHIFGPDSIIIDINRTELDMLGYSYDEIVGKKRWPDLIIPEEKEKFEEHWRTINETGEVRNLEYTLIHKDGHYINVLLNASARFDDEGNLMNTRGSALDITEQKKAEETLKKQKKALEEKTIALTQVISQIEIEKNKIKENIAANVNELIMPSLKKLRLKGASKKYVNLLAHNLKTLVSPFGYKITNRSIKLTPREVEICNMIRDGLTSKDISNLLNVSYQTVDQHRKNIRRKLKICNRKINLTVYLQRR